MKRYEQAIQNFQRDKLLRLITAAVTGVTLAHLLPMSTSTVFLGLYPASILLAMNRFSLGALFFRCVILMCGLISGTLIMEFFQCIPLLTILITYGVFLGILKMFAIRYEMANAYSFMFAYSLSTIYASYPDSSMEVSIAEPYLIQFTLIFLLVWGCFALFPAQLPSYAKSRPVPEEMEVKNGELMVYALIWLGIWLVFLFFEWRFALFAFLSFGGAFRYFERSMMKKIAKENIIAHVFCCSLVSLFSLLLLGICGNILVLFTGVSVLIAPFMYLVVFSPDKELAYRYNTMISALLVPLILYLSTDRAALYQSSLRASLIVFLMIILWLTVEYLYHGVTIINKFSGRFRKINYPGAEHAGDRESVNNVESPKLYGAGR